MHPWLAESGGSCKFDRMVNYYCERFRERKLLHNLPDNNRLPDDEKGVEISIRRINNILLQIDNPAGNRSDIDNDPFIREQLLRIKNYLEDITFPISYELSDYDNFIRSLQNLILERKDYGFPITFIDCKALFETHYIISLYTGIITD